MGFKKGNTYGLKHGLKDTPAYSTWRHIKSRCFNKNSDGYKSHGGRGITMYEPWIKDCRSFYDYVSQLPGYGEPGLSIDRINNNGNYEPGNLRWATMVTQNYNKGLRKDNKTNYTGISFPKNLGKFRVRVRINGKTCNVGVYDNLEEALKARDNYIISQDKIQARIKYLI